MTALLGLLKGRQLFSEVTALLDFDPIGERLGIDRGQLKDLSEVLQTVGVRWGIDRGDRRHKGLPDYAEYSWDYGLQQLLDGWIYGEWAPDDRAAKVVSSELIEAVGSLTRLLRPILSSRRRPLRRAALQPGPMNYWESRRQFSASKRIAGSGCDSSPSRSVRSKTAPRRPISALIHSVKSLKAANSRTVAPPACCGAA